MEKGKGTVSSMVMTARLHTEDVPVARQMIIIIQFYTGMFPVGDTSCRTLIAVCVCVSVCVSADISLNCAKND